MGSSCSPPRASVRYELCETRRDEPVQRAICLRRARSDRASPARAPRRLDRRRACTPPPAPRRSRPGARAARRRRRGRARRRRGSAAGARARAARMRPQKRLRAPPPITETRSMRVPASAARPAPSASAKATPSSTARARSARSVSCVRPTKTPRRVGIVVRRALAGEVGQEQQARARRSAASTSASSAASLAAPVSAAHPREAARRAQDHGHLVPGRRAGSGRRRARRAPGFGREAVAGDEVDARGAEREKRVARARSRRCRPRRRRCRPRRRRSTTSARMPHASATLGAQASGRLGAFDERAASRVREIAGREHLGRPGAARDVEPERAGGVRHVGGVLAASGAGAGSPWAAARGRCGERSAARAPRTQSSFGAVNPGIARLPVMRAAARRAPLELGALGARCGRRSTGSPAAATRSAASSSVAPCIWPESPTAATPRVAPRAASSRTAASVARHQSSGSCSDQSGRGRDTSSGAVACVDQRAGASSRTAFTAEVPRSMPRNALMPGRTHVRRLGTLHRAPASRFGRSPLPRSAPSEAALHQMRGNVSSTQLMPNRCTTLDLDAAVLRDLKRLQKRASRWANSSPSSSPPRSLAKRRGRLRPGRSRGRRSECARASTSRTKRPCPSRAA